MQAIGELIPVVRFLSIETPVGSFRQSDTLVSYQRRSANFSVYGVADEYFDIKANVDFPGGRKLNPLDAEDRRKVVAIGTLVEQELFATRESPIGKALNLNGMQVTVVGVLYDSGREG